MRNDKLINDKSREQAAAPYLSFIIGHFSFVIFASPCDDFAVAHCERGGVMLTRREMLNNVGGLAAAFMACSSRAEASAPIREENKKPGTTEWLLTNTRADPKTRYRWPWIEGYCSRTSVRPGGAIEFKVSTNPPSTFVIDLYRMGHYGGKGGRHMERIGPFRGSPQPDPRVGRERLRECSWATAMRFSIPEGWPSGVYLAKLTEEREKLQSYMIFVVRDDRKCYFLFQCSDTTWAAYNRWPGLWNRESHRRRPRALAQALPPYARIRLRRAPKRADPLHVTSALAAVMAHPVEVDHEGRGRVRADLEFDGPPGADASPGAVALNPRPTVARLWVGARVGQEPLGRSRLLVLFTNGGARFGSGRASHEGRGEATHIVQHFTACKHDSSPFADFSGKII